MLQLIACVVLGVAIYALSAGSQFFDVLNENGQGELANSAFFSNAGFIALIVVAVITIAVTFFGCCGAIKENACMLGTYFAIILVLFIALIVAAVVGYNKSVENIPDPLIKTLEKYGDGTKTKGFWDKIHKDGKCCGVTGWENWKEEKPDKFNGDGDKVPESCCKDFVTDDELQTCKRNPGSITKPKKLIGCYTKLKNAIDSNKSAILGVSITILLIMFMNMIFAFVLCTMVK